MRITGDKFKIGIVGLSQGAGAGFIAANLARYLADEEIARPAVAEIGTGGLYDSLGMDKRFSGRDFFSFHEAALQNRSIRGHVNDYLGVNWMLRKPNEESSTLDIPRTLRLAHNGSGDYMICRLSGIPPKELRQIFWEMDRLLLVIDPLPSRMLPAYEFLCELRKADIPVCSLINKWNGGVDRKEMLRYLRIRELFYLPIVPSETVYSAEYACRAVYDTPSGRELLKEPFCRLAKGILHSSA